MMSSINFLAFRLVCAASVVFLTGCLATPELERGKKSASEAIANVINAATTPSSVTQYRERQKEIQLTLMNAQRTMQSAGLPTRATEFKTIRFRDSAGRLFEVAAVSSFRLTLPTDVLVAVPRTNNDLEPALKAISETLDRANSVDAIDVNVVAPDAESARFIESRLRHHYPQVRLTPFSINTNSVVGHGIEFRWNSNVAINRTVSN